jgi:hypothetical protein
MLTLYHVAELRHALDLIYVGDQAKSGWADDNPGNQVAKDAAEAEPTGDRDGNGGCPKEGDEGFEPEGLRGRHTAAAAGGEFGSLERVYRERKRPVMGPGSIPFRAGLINERIREHGPA